MMQKIIDANPGGAAAKTESMTRYGISRNKAAREPPKPQPVAAPPPPKMAPMPEYSYSDLDQLLKGDGKTSRASTRVHRR